MMTACEQTLADGSSIMMFPEGTRSMDGRLKAFKHGAFTLAQRMRAPILPIVVEGTAAALPKHGFILQGRHAIRIRVLDAIPYTRFANESVEALTDRVRSVIAAELDPGFAEGSSNWPRRCEGLSPAPEPGGDRARAGGTAVS